MIFYKADVNKTDKALETPLELLPKCDTMGWRVNNSKSKVNTIATLLTEANAEVSVRALDRACKKTRSNRKLLELLFKALEL